MENKKNVAAVIVTYNRKVLLMECLTAILAQTNAVTKIVIINNASTDGTEELLEEKGILENPAVEYHRMETNTGGSGGFYTGLDVVKNMSDIDWAWIMDDDTIPENMCLEKLLQASEEDEKASFFASCVKGMNNEPMNVPFIDERTSDNGYEDWYMKLDKSLVKIRKATFVSLLIKRNAIQKCGLPCREYFIWGDDFEYTTRLTKYYGPAYLVGDSWVCHKRFNAKAISIENEEDAKRIKNYFYSYRNTMLNMYLYNGKSGYLKQFMKYILFSFKLLKMKDGFSKFIVVQHGIWNSFHMRKYFQRYVENQLDTQPGERKHES